MRSVIFASILQVMQLQDPKQSVGNDTHRK
jgi:hypothetical protein